MSTPSLLPTRARGRPSPAAEAQYRKSTRWRSLPAPALADLIQTIRRRAGAGHHLSQADWHQLDLMRRRLARLNEAQS